MNEKYLYDFYTLDTKVHFAQEEMTEKEAKEYARKYNLCFEAIEKK